MTIAGAMMTLGCSASVEPLVRLVSLMTKVKALASCFPGSMVHANISLFVLSFLESAHVTNTFPLASSARAASFDE